MQIRDIKSSSEKIGQLYPILVDNFGQIIDGEHRYKADKNWKKVKLENIKTTKDLLIARLACNTVRRTTTSKEKTELLDKLGEICQNEGVSIGRISYELMYQTGMSYRWIAKYLPKRFKDSRRVRKTHGPKKSKKVIKKQKADSFTLQDSPEGLLDVCAYRNTNFVNITMQKSLFTKLERKAKKLDTTVTNLLYNAIMQVLDRFHQKL
ncbi:MAG: ParB N-terminal domain-containing protein [Promethearchaeota archaeon]